MSPARRTALALVAATCVAGLSCSSGDGLVEVNWQFEDASLERIFPQGSRGDTCEFPSASGIRYDLAVQLTIAENSDACANGWEDPSCVVVEQRQFDCARSRGTATSVAVSAEGDADPGYLMFVEPLIDPTDTAAFVPNSSCVGRPGPRVRRVLPGRITDLEVVQFVFLVSDASPIDIDSCRP